MDNDIILSVNNLFKHFEDVTALNGVSFEIRQGESVGIVGESGCGKSTTARIISGLDKPSSGTVLFRGEKHSLKHGIGRSKVNMVFQDPVSSFDRRMTVFESLYEALRHTRKITAGEATAVIENALETVELPKSYKDRRISQLSGGECQRIAIARAVLTEPELLICDEATSALDVSVQAQIIHLLVELKEKNNYTYLFISHDLALVACMCTRVIVMYRGKIVEEGDVGNVMKTPLHPYTRLLLSCGDAFALDASGNTSALPKVPSRSDTKNGCCPFYAYCEKRRDICMTSVPVHTDFGNGHKASCHFAGKGE